MDDNDTQGLAHQQELEHERYLDETDFTIDRKYYFSTTGDNNEICNLQNS